MELQEFFARYRRVALAFSGGTDSAFLLRTACDCGAQVQPYFIKTAFQPAFELEDARRLAGELGMRIPSFGHAGDGNLHVYLCRDGMDAVLWEEKMAKAFDRMYRRAAELGGQVSGEHGIGYAKKEYLQRQLGETPVGLMRGIKQVFDPKGILNPGKVVS